MVDHLTHPISVILKRQKSFTMRLIVMLFYFFFLKTVLKMRMPMHPLFIEKRWLIYSPAVLMIRQLFIAMPRMNSVPVLPQTYWQVYKTATLKQNLCGQWALIRSLGFINGRDTRLLPIIVQLL